jgi:glycosyltransferase involved in cell wall biosynthesis
MRIALIGNDYIQQFPLQGYGGIETCVENLAQGLFENKLDFFVVCPKRSNVKDYPFEVYETEEEPTSISKKNSSYYAYSVSKVLENLKFDVIWSQSYWSIEPLLKFNKPIICTFQDSCEKQYGWIKKYEQVKYRFISQFQYKNWIKEDWEKEISFYCYTGLDNSEFELSINKEEYFLWCAGLQWGLEAKGLDIFINLAKINKNYHFIAYGSGNPELEKYLYSLKISNFEFKGALNRGHQHRNAFKKASKFIMPTNLPEALGRTVIESFSKGTPVIGSYNGALDELIINEINGKKCLSLDDYSQALEITFNYNTIFTDSYKFSTEFEIQKMLKESSDI